jgi:hypothetical protein
VVHRALIAERHAGDGDGLGPCTAFEFVIKLDVTLMAEERCAADSAWSVLESESG